MAHWNRALTTLVAAAAAGFLLWFVPHFDRWATGGYWGVLALTALAGVLIGISQLQGRDGKPTASFVIAFVPVLIAAGWVILAAQPQGNWIRDHVLSWSGDMGIGHAVHNLGEHVAVLAFGLGVVFGLRFEPKMLRRAPKHEDEAPTAITTASSPPPVATEHAQEEHAAHEPDAQHTEDGEQTPDAAPTVRYARTEKATAGGRAVSITSVVTEDDARTL